MPFKKHHQVTIYTSGSPMCELAKKYFREQAIDFEEVNINLNKDFADRLHDVSSDMITPTVELDGRVISGYQPELYSLLLEKDRV